MLIQKPRQRWWFYVKLFWGGNRLIAHSRSTRRWMFKRPMPTDFFRTMEDVSGVDLDWFWNGWFYGTDHVDIALDKVSRLRIDTKDPEIEKVWQEEEKIREPLSRVRANNGLI